MKLAPASLTLPHRFQTWLVGGAVVLLSACGGGDAANTAASNAPAEAQEQALAQVTTSSATTTATTTRTVTADPLTVALNTGNPSYISTATVLSGAKTFFAAQKTSYANTKALLFGLNFDGTTNATSLGAVTWSLSHDSSSFAVLDSSRNQVVLPSNWSYSNNAAGSGVALAVVGSSPVTGGRYAAFGGNPLGARGNAAMDQVVKNTVAYLTKKTSYSSFKVVTAHLPGTETYWFPHESAVRNWFKATYPGITINGVAAANLTQDNTCDGAALDACLQGADLLVLGREQGPAAYDGAQVMQAVTNAQARGIPVLYLHHYRDVNDLASRMTDYMALQQQNNYWAQDGLKDFAPASLPALPGNMANAQALLNRLELGSFTTTWSGCTTSGRIDCSGDSAYMNEFGTPAAAIRNTLRSLDAQPIGLFAKPGYTLEKLLVLLGDRYRMAVSYPMDKVTSGQNFFRAYFADMTAYINRPYSAVATSLGNFSGLFPASTAKQTRSVTLALPNSGTRDFSTGLYVMPGQSVTLTRVDKGTSTLTAGLNMLRDTTWVFNPNKYTRPTQLQSPRIALLAGQSVTLTSPYGGPLYLFAAAAPGNAVQNISVTAAGVITHPSLNDLNSGDQVTRFRAELNTTSTNWVTLTTDFLTVHSNLPNFRATMNKYGGDLNKLLSTLWTYMIKDTYELAGFNSASGSFSLAPTVTAYCTTARWDCAGLQHRRDVMQHVISDNYAACGNGCSGNPYDQDWALDPLGWGETHEIGHNLQVGRLKIYDGLSTEVSNNIFPIHKQMMYNQSAAGLAAPIWRGVGLNTGTPSIFSQLKTALASTDPFGTMKAQIWTDTAYAANNGQRLMFYRQLPEFARYYNSNFSNGWELYTLMYLLNRNMDANSSATAWPTVAAGFGFGTYASYPSSMDGNDFMLIATSSIIKRDMRPVFDLWGVTYSSAAAAQVAAYAYPPAQKLAFPMSDLNQFGTRIGAPVVMTATAVYPAGY